MKKTLTLITLAVMVALATLAATMSMASVTWTVAGVVDLCGTEWDPTDANNDMTMQSDGVTYVLIKENCELEAGIPYEYKVVANHSWSESYGNANGGNASFMVEESGKYTITFSFNSSTHTVSASAANTASYTPDKKTWTIAGSEALMGSEWDASDVQNDMHETSDGVYTLLKENVALDAGVYEYKVCANHRWTVSYGGENGVNMSLTIGHSGLYNVSFTFDVVSKSLTASASLAEGTISVSSALEIIDGYEDGGRSDDLYFVQGVISGDVLVYNEQACFMLSDMEDSSKKISVQVKGFNNEAYEEGAVKEGDQIVVCACLYKYLSDGSVTPYLFPGYIFELQKRRTAITTSTSTMISFNDEATAGNVQSSYAKDDFVLNCYDNSSKFAIDANSAYFGDVEDCHFFSYRLKTGGASTASRYLSLSIPHAGKLRIYARTGNNADTNRNVVMTQNGQSLADKILLQSDAVPTVMKDSEGNEQTEYFYPFVEAEVEEGTVDITFPNGSVNFYGFELLVEETTYVDDSQASHDLRLAIAKARKILNTQVLTDRGSDMLNAAIAAANEALDSNDDDTMTAAKDALNEVIEDVLAHQVLESEIISLKTSTTTYYNGDRNISGSKATVTPNVGKSSSDTPRSNWNYLYMYQGNTLTITSVKPMVDVIFSLDSGSTLDATVDTGRLQGNHWRGDAKKVTFTMTGSADLTLVTITYDEPSDEALVERIAYQLERSQKAIDALVYSNVQGSTELKALMEDAKTVTTESGTSVLKNILQQLKDKTDEVVALDKNYQALGKKAEQVETIAQNNRHAKPSILSGATALIAEIRQGLADGIYSASDITKLQAWLNDYASSLALIFLDINVNEEGSLGDLILDEVENFTDVYGLTVSGRLNTADMTNIKSRLTNVRYLDMTGTNLTEIANGQFSGNTKLSQVYLPHALQIIGDNAFSSCTSLWKVVLPSTLKSIGNNAFYGCENIEEIELPEGLTTIGKSAFECTRQQYYDRNNSSYYYMGGNLKKLRLPSTLRSLGNNAFYCQTEIDSLYIADGLTSIPQNAFYQCNKLSYLRLPSTLKDINSSAFSYCTSLEKLELPSPVYYLGSGAFSNCTALEEVSMSGDMKYVYGPFSGCNKLKKMRLEAVIPPSTNNYNVMNGLESQCTLTVPNLSVKSYKQTSYWDQFNIVGEDILPEWLTIYKDYRLSWSNDLPVEYKPNFYIWSNAALTLGGSTTLSAGDFRMSYSCHDVQLSSYYQDIWGNTTYNRDNCFAALMTNGHVRADNILIELYTSINRWDFISFPFDVRVGDIRLSFDGSPFVIRKYDGQKRAEGLNGETWVNMTADSTLHAGQGYIIQSASTDANRDYNGFYISALQTVNKNNIFTNEDVEVALNSYESEFPQNRSWNLIGNPYPTYYDIRAMQTSSPVTVWDTYNKNYQAYSPEDDAYILNPGQAFFVQCPVNEDKITFLTEGRQTGMEVRSVSYGNRAARTGQRSVFNILLTGNDMNDRTRFVINAEASMDYETGRDAGKLMSMEQRTIQLYTQQHDVRYAINERPLNDGIIELGLQVCASGNYTLTLDTAVDNEVYLIDRETGVETRLDGTDGYSFYVDKGTIEGRFAIRLGDGYVTGISNVSSFNDGVKPNEDNYYNLNGVRVQQPQKGLYIQNGRKVVVK